MSLSSKEKTGYIICIILSILLVGLHYASASHGYKFAKDWDNDLNNTQSYLYLKQQKQQTAFVIIVSGLTLIISITLLIGVFRPFSPRLRHTLAALNLVLEFSIAIVIALRASNNSNLRNAYPTLQDQYSNFKYYYRLSIADTVITFLLEIVYLAIIFLGTLRQIVFLEVITPIAVEVPPLSNRQF